MRILIALPFLAALAFASPALADPCKAVPDKGKAPAWLAPGRTFEGTVRYVGDGDSLCVGSLPDPATWVEVRLADFNAPELSEPGGADARKTLIRLVTGKPLVCRAKEQSYDRIVARCTLHGVSVGALMRKAGVKEGGR